MKNAWTSDLVLLRTEICIEVEVYSIVGTYSVS